VKAKLLRLVFDTAALRGFSYPACGAFAELIYFGGSRSNHGDHEEQQKGVVPQTTRRTAQHVESPI